MRHRYPHYDIIALIRRRDVADAAWSEAASLLAGIAIRLPAPPSAADRQRARDLDQFLSRLASPGSGRSVRSDAPSGVGPREVQSSRIIQSGETP